MARSALYNLVPPADVATGGLRFRARSITVNNTTGQWWDVDGLPVSPYTIGVVISLRGPSEAPRVRARTPVGFTSTLVAGETGTIIFDEAALPASPGVPFTRATIASGFTGTPTLASDMLGTGTISIAVPAGAQSGDILVLCVQSGFGAPAINTPAGFTQQVTVVPNMRLSIFTAPFTGQGTIAVTHAGVSAAAAMFLVRGFAGVFGATPGTNFGAAAALAIPGPATATGTPAICIYFDGTWNNALTWVSWSATGNVDVVRGVNSVGGGNTICMSIAAVPLTAVGGGPANTGTWSAIPTGQHIGVSIVFS